MAFLKDPDAVKDYLSDWTPYLTPPEIITAATVTADPGITVNSHAITTDGTGVVFWLSGGSDVTNYNIVIHVTTSAGRQDDDTVKILCRNR
ncbi:MAG TPA: hypothetical protein VFB19_18630 [Mycobacterium sp.]|nr:hypothetical protein [Mycobacterium sp.]